jgi:uncharacterized protein (TIGR02145 family)
MLQKLAFIFLFFPLLTTAQLKEFEVSEMERPDVSVVQANGQWPDDALLLVYSSLDGLQFRSSMGAVDKQTYNNRAGRYEILVKPLKQMIFAAKPGFMELKIATINPNPKDVFYYLLEQKLASKQNQIEELKELLKEGILTIDQFNTFSEKILGSAGSGLASVNPSSIVMEELSSSRRFSDEEKVCVDIDGNSYPTRQIGNQLWMAQNLRVKRFINGDEIQDYTPKKLHKSKKAGFTELKTTAVKSVKDVASALMASAAVTKKRKGYSYNWMSVEDSRGLCPTDWHVPSKKEWNDLFDYLGPSSVYQLKIAGGDTWVDCTNCNNETGFAAYPAGMIDDQGRYEEIGNSAFWWSSTATGKSKNSAYRIEIKTGYNSVSDFSDAVNSGLSVRCIRD